MKRIKIYILLVLSLFSVSIFSQTGNFQGLDSQVKFNKTKESVYYFLQQISMQTGYMFIYDSDLIDNNKIVKLSKKKNSLKTILDEIIINKNIEIKVVDSYILLIKNNKNDIEDQTEREVIKNEKTNIILRGRVHNSDNGKPISHCSVGISNSSIGTVANNEGDFKIIIPDSLLDSSLVISHIGYKVKTIKVSLCTDIHLNIYIDPQVISLGEAIINAVEPLKLLDSLRANIKYNYPQYPTYITGFYREGINYKNKHIDLTESVLKVYKSEYNSSKGDQAKMLKMRRVKDVGVNDSIRAIVKIKSGISACFMLDLMKNPPNFLDFYRPRTNPYNYKYSGVTDIEDRKVYIISFEQNNSITDPLYVGELYIDAENFSLIEARFKINPKYIKDATPLYILHHHRNLRVELKNVEYIVSYKRLSNNTSYLNRIKGSLDFNIKNKKWLFSVNVPISVWFEFINCHIDTTDVTRFSKKERIHPHKVFSENQYTYDPLFWGQFNTILPEKELKVLIQKNMNETIDGEYLELID